MAPKRAKSFSDSQYDGMMTVSHEGKKGKRRNPVLNYDELRYGDLFYSDPRDLSIPAQPNPCPDGVVHSTFPAASGWVDALLEQILFAATSAPEEEDTEHNMVKLVPWTSDSEPEVAVLSRLYSVCHRWKGILEEHDELWHTAANHAFHLHDIEALEAGCTRMQSSERSWRSRYQKLLRAPLRLTEMGKLLHLSTVVFRDPQAVTKSFVTSTTWRAGNERRHRKGRGATNAPPFCRWIQRSWRRREQRISWRHGG
jgi:hypothetical protein